MTLALEKISKDYFDFMKVINENGGLDCTG
jgi:hypothetical protein